MATPNRLNNKSYFKLEKDKMARHRSSPRCSFCWGLGHAKNHCPQIKERAENGSEYYKGILEQQKLAVKNRKCSYCFGTGHNRRTCPLKAADAKIFNLVVEKYKHHVMGILHENGYTVGSLIKYTISDATRHIYSQKNSADLTKGTLAIIVKTPDMDEEDINYIPDSSWKISFAPEFFNSEEMTAYQRFVYKSSDRTPRLEMLITIQSLTGTGLGYWANDNLMYVNVGDLPLNSDYYSLSYASRQFELISK